MIVLGCDHGGLKIKNAIIDYLKNSKIEYKDFGCYSADSVDYPHYAFAVANAVAKQEAQFGILCCSTGLGMAIAANKVDGVRAVTLADEFSAQKTREHNNANVLCLGGKIVDDAKAVKLASIFLNTQFEGGRHERRVDMISQIEEGKAV
ncbi:MAG: ribose 5-phosphate isomerase B [Oscillospiraceae bacterium]|jgi:ribose 5-phosphate isomerase B|nr:ribose 5-phosphate isomerase B [Oscillospiraceae bacterium]